MVAAYVLDSSALLAYLDDTHSAERVAALLMQARAEKVAVHMSAVNWGEVFYLQARGRNEHTVEEVRRLLQRFPIQLSAADARMAESAAQFKVIYKLHYADCFAGALALDKKATLVTSDSDFKRAQGQLKIMWLANVKKR